MARSNRPLTQFAVNKVQEFVELGPTGFKNATAANTTVEFDGNNSLTVRLFGEQILEIFRGEHGYDSVVVYDGSFYDGLGRPTRTTRERLNGILDYLGSQQIIPEGVRIFFDPESKICFVGRDDERQPIGKRYDPVCLVANPIYMEFQ